MSPESAFTLTWIHTRRRPHARVLLNNLLLDKIATFLPPKDLLHLRRTATAWNRAFILRLRRTHPPIQLVTNCVGGEALLLLAGSSMQKYTELMRRSAEIPFDRYEVSDLIANDANQLKLYEFLSVCGDTISSIKFSADHWLQSDTDNLIQVIRTIVFDNALAPNLEELCLALRGLGTYYSPMKQMDAQARARPVPCLNRLRLTWNASSLETDAELKNFRLFTLVDELFRNAASLEELYCSIAHEEEHGTLRVLQGLRDHCPSLDKLRKLTILDAQLADLQILEQMASRKQNNLCMQDFSVSIKHGNGDVDRNLETLHVFLATQCSTLRRLSIHLDGAFLAQEGPGRLSIQLPKMAALRTLIFTGTGQSNIHFDGGTLGDAFPSLKAMDVNWMLSEGERGELVRHGGDALLVASLAHPALTELILTGTPSGPRWTLESDARLEELVQRLSAVTRLEVCIPSDQLPQCIWTCWPALNYLRIEYIAYSDEIGSLDQLDEWLCGVPRSRFGSLEAEPDLQVVRAERCHQSDSLKILRSLLGIYKTLPAISDLPCLRSFTLILKPTFLGVDFSFTDIGGYFGLAMASSSLERLVLRSCQPGQQFFSTECESLVRYVQTPHAQIKFGG